MKKVFWEAQIPLLLVGLLLYPMSGFFNGIDNWIVLILVSIILLVLLYVFLLCVYYRERA